MLSSFERRRCELSEFDILCDKEVFSARELARMLGVSHFTILRGIRKGTIRTEPGVDVLGNETKWRVIPRQEAERLARQQKSKTHEEKGNTDGR